MFPCQRYLAQPISRRELLSQSAHGFGTVALSTMLARSTTAFASSGNSSSLAARATHFPAKAKNVIFLYMDGGPSQVDTFDPKPMLDKYDGRPPHEVIGKLEPTQFANIGKILKSPWKFRQYGESGIPVSDLFPHVATCADDLAVVRSVVAPFSEHTFANYFLHTSDVTFDMANNKMEVHSNASEPWRITLLDTGLETMTGGRVKRAERFIGDQPFMHRPQ